MTRAVIAIADQVIVQELRSRLDQSDVEVEVVFVAESTQEMVSAVLSHRPALLFVHDQLGPAMAMPVVRDLTLRNPALAVMVVTTAETAESFSSALDAGARGVLAHPFGLEDVNSRLATVLEWSQSIRAAIAETPGSANGSANRGARVIAVSGAKGGVGTTIVASHLAWDIARSEPKMRVCLVDLDLEKGDVPSYLDVSHRVSVADLAKISEDLAARAVSDTVVVHSSGLHLLLAPVEIRDTEFVTPEAVRRILAQLRTLYHLVIIDTGSAITTNQAAAIESADLTLQLVTADVPALRAARRQVVAWESLGVTSGDKVRVVVNRFVRRSEIQQDTIDMLTLGQRSEVLVPDLDRSLERAGNSRTPSDVRNATWWRSLRAIGQELDVSRAYHEAVASAARSNEVAQPERELVTTGAAVNGTRRAVRRRDSGQASLETVGVLPLALISMLLCIQIVLVGVAFVWSGVAATEAARAASIGKDPRSAALDAIPGGLRNDVTVTSSGSTVSVNVHPPLLIGSGVSRSAPIGVQHRVVEEPR